MSDEFRTSQTWRPILFFMEIGLALQFISYMPRINPPQQSQFPYHIAGRCINRDWFKIPMPNVWNIMSEQLRFIHHAFNFRINAFTLMSNHFHLIAGTPDANLALGMSYFMRETSREIVRQAGRINQTWCGPFFRCLLDKNNHFLNAYKYVYRNPVAAGLVRRCEAYPFSTLNGLLGFQQLVIPVEHDRLLFDPGLNLEHLEWLNHANPNDEIEVKKALNKTSFTFQKRSGHWVRGEDFVY